VRTIWTIAQREYRHFFITPIAYFVAITMLLVIGLVFVDEIGRQTYRAMQGYGSSPTIAPITWVYTFMLMLLSPATTMRLISDEARGGTLELLLTAPVNNHELVIGKWLGALLFALTLLAATLVYPLVLNSMVDPGIDQQMMMTAYLGAIMAAAAFIALGTGISAVFSNQIAALLITWLTFFFFWWLAGIAAGIIQSSSGIDFLEYLHMPSHFRDSLNVGLLRLSDIVYFVSLTALGLFAGTMAVEVRRWR
jgi:ABC-2 type transport system permease protein